MICPDHKELRLLTYSDYAYRPVHDQFKPKKKNSDSQKDKRENWEKNDRRQMV